MSVNLMDIIEDPTNMCVNSLTQNLNELLTEFFIRKPQELSKLKKFQTKSSLENVQIQIQVRSNIIHFFKIKEKKNLTPEEKMKEKHEEKKQKTVKREQKAKERQEEKIKKVSEKPKTAYYFFTQDEKHKVKQRLIDNGLKGNAKTIKKQVHVELQNLWKTLKSTKDEVYNKYKLLEEESNKIVVKT
jgi:hypothetical protein